MGRRLIKANKTFFFFFNVKYMVSNTLSSKTFFENSEMFQENEGKPFYWGLRSFFSERGCQMTKTNTTLFTENAVPNTASKYF